MASRSQFRILYRSFFARIIDLEVLSQRGDLADAMARAGSLLAAFSLVLALVIVPRYLITTRPRSSLLYALWNDQEFLLSTTIAAAGLISVLTWNAMFPDLRDCMVLGTLPVPLRKIALAKAAAAGTVLALALAAANAFTGPAFPFAIADTPGAVPVAAFGWWITNAGAGLFVFCAVQSFQGIASQILPWRFFFRISGLLQLLALAAVLVWFFLSPPFAETVLHAPWKEPFLPSYWFTGLLHLFVGGRTAALDNLARMALRNLGIAGAAALTTSLLGWRRNPRRLVEAPQITPSGGMFFVDRLAPLLCPERVDRAVWLFTVRTLFRSRQHRLILAVYGGAAAALAAALLSGIFKAPARVWTHPNVPMLAIGWMSLFIAVAGIRAVFVLPHETSANWLFRVNRMHPSPEYFEAVRRTLILIGVAPVWIAVAALYITLWNGGTGLAAALLLAPASLILVDGSLRNFRKIPFTCSWLPESAQNRVGFVIWAVVLIVFAAAISAIELWGIYRLDRVLVMALILFAAAAETRAANLSSHAGGLQFTGDSGEGLQTIDVGGDGEPELAPDAPIHAPFLRWRHFAALLLIAGTLYEQSGRASDRRQYPQIGRSYEAGGRRLNISCAGQGSPAAIFESDWNEPGAGWIPAQREVARFTRACWYDRAGYGWSDPASSSHYSDNAARDLHQLLRAAGVAPPYLLISSGMGTFHARVFRSYYPQDVSGLVFLDPMNEDLAQRIPGYVDMLDPVLRRLYPVVGWFGGWRLLAERPAGAPPAFSLSEWRTVAALQLRSDSLGTALGELPLAANGQLARAAERGSTRLAVLSATQPGPVEDAELADRELTLRFSRELAARSDKGVFKTVTAHQNRIWVEAPQAVADTVRELLDQERDTTR
jgi:hypothetical protein